MVSIDPQCDASSDQEEESVDATWFESPPPSSFNYLIVTVLVMSKSCNDEINDSITNG